MAEHADLPRARRDRFEVAMRPMLIGGVLLALFVSSMLGLAKWLYPESAAVLPLAEPQFPQPRLQAAPTADFAAFHRAQIEQLGTAAWMDASHQAVRVPIDDAMAKLARDGIADWPTSKQRQQP